MPKPNNDKWSKPLTKVYEELTDDILINIAAHFNVADDSGTAVEWQLKKLAQIGKLTNETIKLIAEKTGQNKEMIEAALISAGLEAIKDMEPALRESVKRGLLEEAPYDMDESVKRTMGTYSQQAKTQLNLVNTRMLTSTLEQYQKIVSNTLALERQLNKTQEILNKETGGVLLGVSSRTQAVRKAVADIAKEGITGFIDKAGRKWSAEAYVNMDIRTTAGNVATKATMNRNKDYGNDLVSIPILAAARPLCYPWQGKVISTANRSGYTTDLHGNAIKIYPLNQTSYGEPAGLWGINCHHTPPNVFISGYSLLRGEVPPKEENDKKYDESQKQRELERNIRYAKRDAMMADKMGDKEGFEKAAARVKAAKSVYSSFINETGRTQRLDRTQVNGYNRSVSNKAVKAQKEYNPENEATIKAVTGARITNIDGGSAKKHAEKYYGLVRSMKTDVERIANNTGFSKNDIKKIKDYLFTDEHDLGSGEPRRFTPDFAIAQSWQRLIDGKNIQNHDLTLLNHEILEKQLMKDGLTQDEAHKMASKQYNYQEEVNKYYDKIKKH